MDYLRRALPGSEALRRAEGLLELLQAQASVDDSEGKSLFKKHVLICVVLRGGTIRDLMIPYYRFA